MSEHPAYKNYWRRKQLLAKGHPPFDFKYWWPSDGLCETDQLYFDAIRDCPSLLDIGAGDGRMMRRFQASGYAGEYHTLDIGTEFEHTYRDLSEVKRPYAAIVCFDVIEHMSLIDGLTLLERLVGLLLPGGVLIVQTPNARCIRNAMGTDMTHMQIYNADDLWSFLTCLDLNVAGYRIALCKPPSGVRVKARSALSRWIASRVLGADSADNIAVIARKRVNPT